MSVAEQKRENGRVELLMSGAGCETGFAWLSS